METIFDWLKMNDFRDMLGSKMSTGMRQKVSIARTIVHDPPVLIFDEPTSGLDVLVPRVVLQKILELRDHGQDDHLLHALDARGGEALLSAWRSSTRDELQVEASPANCSSGLTSPIWKSYSSTWSTGPTSRPASTGSATAGGPSVDPMQLDSHLSSRIDLSLPQRRDDS